MNYRDYDCGVITAHNVGYTEQENKQRNKQLHAKIQLSKYAVVTLNFSGYDKFFVVDHKNTGKLGYDLTKWSKEYEQEKLRFMPAGMVDVSRSLTPLEYEEFRSKEKDIQNYYEVANILGKLAIAKTAERNWKDIQI